MKTHRRRLSARPTRPVIARTASVSGVAVSSEVAYYADNFPAAVRLSRAALAETAVGDDLFSTVCHQAQLARNLHASGDMGSATHWLGTALRNCLANGLWMPAVDALTTTARIEADRHNPSRAATLLAAADALRPGTGRFPATVERPRLNELADVIRAQLPRADHALAQAEGRGMKPAQALKYALYTMHHGGDHQLTSGNGPGRR
ncbi:hypothetical protein [Kitasatospora sp. LaBMicrA B282]|uniref:hypothetical protein n=1 Tax=Kitasatospora sp. LaBMicrA B282 TaxID=3420949 RepID=UPI003D139B38